MEPGTIIIPHGVAIKMRKDFDVSYFGLRKALRGQSQSDKAKMLRAVALQRGGMYVVKPEIRVKNLNNQSHV